MLDTFGMHKGGKEYRGLLVRLNGFSIKLDACGNPRGSRGSRSKRDERNRLRNKVGATGIEPMTSTVSTLSTDDD